MFWHKLTSNAASNNSLNEGTTRRCVFLSCLTSDKNKLFLVVPSIFRLLLLVAFLVNFGTGIDNFLKRVIEWSPTIVKEVPIPKGNFDEPDSLPETFAHQWSSFDCGGWPEWPVSPNYTESMTVFQNWIFAWQHSCDKGLNRNPPQSWGIGRTIHLAIKHLLTSIESNSIYRPNEQNAARIEGQIRQFIHSNTSTNLKLFSHLRCILMGRR